MVIAFENGPLPRQSRRLQVSDASREQHLQRLIGRRIRLRREAGPLTQRDLAANIAGMTQSQVHYAEAGRPGGRFAPSDSR